MREKTAEKHFKTCYRRVRSFIKHDGMTRTRELDRCGKKLIGKSFRGVFAQDQVPKLEVGQSAIINNDISTQDGEHWVGAYMTEEGHLLIFDSFGRDISKLLPILSKQVRTLSTDPDRDQKYIEANCGQLSCAWVLLVKKYGEKAGRLI